ncbi:hypothetical protein IMCC1989_296 [gamma proteobacterium IMCC1989]|nr:hypothetical protein IMCC1989_296 [gamma proteobacterium IMCC1989]
MLEELVMDSLRVPTSCPPPLPGTSSSATLGRVIATVNKTNNRA